MSSRLPELANAVAKGDAVFFIGAGLSAGAGLPTWVELVDEMRAALTPAPTETNPMLIAQFYRNSYGDHALYTFLRKALRGRNVPPTPAHLTLASLPVRAFFTTNYDSLLERALEANHRPVHVITDDQEVGLWNEADEVQVLKLHGDLDQASSIVLTEEDYVRFLCDNLAVQRKLTEAFSWRTVIFLGYSLSDPDISLIYNNILYELGKLKRPAYILTFEKDIHKLREWERRKIFPIVVPLLPGQQKQVAIHNYLQDLKQELAKVRLQVRSDILVVEDDEDNRNILHLFLSRRYSHVSIECASDGLDALMRIAKRKPKVILVDLLMPRMDGWELIALLRDDPDHKDTEILIISAVAVDAVQAARYGVRWVFRKPAPLAELAKAIDTILDAA